MAATTGGGDAVRLRDDSDFRRYWAARQVSLSGSLITAVAMPVLVYTLTGSPGLTALTTVLEALPYLLVGLFAGVVGDRFDRRRVMVAADLANVVVIGSVPVAWWLGGLTVPHVLLAGLVAQTLFTFFDGASFGALPVLVGRERIGEANAAIWGFGGVLDLTVPALVGLALAVVHPAELLALDALTFLASAMVIRSIQRAMSATRDREPAPLGMAGVLDDIREGLSFLWRHDGVRTNTLIGMLQSTAGAGWVALWVPWADRTLGIGTSGWRFGVVFSVWGLGGILASALTPWLLRRATPARLTLLAIPLSGVAGVCVALATHWVVAAVLMVAWGVAYQVVIINSLTYRQQVTPEHLLSRVNTAGRMMSWGIGWTFGAVVAGVLATHLGVPRAMLALTCVGLVAAAYAWLSPLRRIAAAQGRETATSGTPT